MRILLWLVLAGAVFMGYRHYQANQIDTMPALADSNVTNPLLSSTPAPMAPAVQDIAPPQAAFQCDGRQHCSQMSSLAEAQFFLKNCPDTKMDGNHDGEPCEQQFGH
jgi:hypothetical protein